MRQLFQIAIFAALLFAAACGKGEPKAPNGDPTASKVGNYYQLNNIKYSVSGTQATVVGFVDGYVDSHANDALSLTIPASITIKKDGENVQCAVTDIAANAFSGNPITSVVIPASVKSIGSSAFANTKLTSVSIPGGSIGSKAFRGCRSLNTVTIGSGVTQIGSECFVGTSLKSVSIPGGSIDSEAFYGCDNL